MFTFQSNFAGGGWRGWATVLTLRSGGQEQNGDDEDD
jgi:hypothetical protein